MQLPSRALLIAATMTLLPACLSDMHRIPRGELIRLSQTHPDSRGNRVRVIQGLPGEEAPPMAPGVRSNTTVIIGGGYSGSVAPPVSSPKLAKMKADEAKAWIVIAAAVASALALSEGARYDGWVKLHPMHPVHLFGPYGEHRWIPLADLDPDAVAWTSKALVRPGEGPWDPLGRAPLNRVGFSYSLTLGAAELPSAAEEANGVEDPAQPGFMAHISLGYFPAQYLGILLDFGLGFRDNDFGDTVFEGRNSFELQILPFSSNPVHAGGYVDIGLGLRLEDGAEGEDMQSFLIGGGGILQFELTTRLTLTGRAGITYVFGEPTAEASLGVSVY